MKTSKAEKCWADNHKHNILRLFDVWLKYFLPQLKEKTRSLVIHEHVFFYKKTIFLMLEIRLRFS